MIDDSSGQRNRGRRGRYAPSPTGSLHLGNARSALVAWLRARSAGADFVMRVEDLDQPRTVPEAVTGNLEELRWLGLDWDEGPDTGGAFGPYLQSQRYSLYDQALRQLEASGRLFQCYLSRRELREISSAPHGSAPVYGDRERRLNERLAAIKREQGKTPSIRLLVEPGELAFNDLLHGWQRFDAASEVGDIVLRRADGAWAYQFAVVVDDAAMAIGEVVRGDDLLASTAAQLAVYRALGADAPDFAHVPLLLDESGQRLAKRLGSLTLAGFRQEGTDPTRIVGLLGFTLGLLRSRTPITPRRLLDEFDVQRLKREPYRLTATDMAWLRRLS